MVAPADKKAAEPAKDAAPADQDQQVLIEEEDAFEEFAAQQTGAFSLLSLSLSVGCPPVMPDLRAPARERPTRVHADPLNRWRARALRGQRTRAGARRSRSSVVGDGVSPRTRAPRSHRLPSPSPKQPTQNPQTVTDETVVEEEANEALWQADWDDEDTSADFQTKLKAELQAAAAQAQAAK